FLSCPGIYPSPTTPSTTTLSLHDALPILHSHSDWTLLEDGDAQSKIRQGVTTEIIGESSSAGPFQGKLKPRTVSVKNESIEIRADRKSTRLNSSHQIISYAVFCLKKKIKT